MLIDGICIAGLWKSVVIGGRQYEEFDITEMGAEFGKQ